MIGKIKKFNFESLFILNTFALIVTSYFFNNFIFTGVYILFFFISIFTTKNGLKIIKKLIYFKILGMKAQLITLKKVILQQWAGFL